MCSNTDKTESGKPRPKPSQVVEGTFLLPFVWKLDPSPAHSKAFAVVATITGLILLFFISRVITLLFPNIDVEWDQRNQVESTGIWAILELTEKALKIPKAWATACFQATGAFVVALVLLDVLLGTVSKSSTDPFPASWQTDNTLCYHDMFSEPTRFGRLIRRPGNTLSNATYLFGSFSVLGSVFYNCDATNALFWLADLQYGVLLLILALSSFCWHGTNAPVSQYIDIWSMNCCILYLIIRLCCLGVVAFLFHYTNISLELARTLGSGLCALLYGAVVVSEAQTMYYKWYLTGYAHGKCPFSVRARLLGKSNIGGRQEDATVTLVAIFGAMPAVYYTAPLMIQVLLLNSVGSVLAGNLLTRSLVVGWTYRLWDRWCFDGNVVMNYIVSSKPSLLRTACAAIFSPTANLHAFTGITLIAGYIHVRSLEDQFDPVA